MVDDRVQCKSCFAKSPSGSTFCGQCGTPFADSTSTHPSQENGGKKRIYVDKVFQALKSEKDDDKSFAKAIAVVGIITVVLAMPAYFGYNWTVESFKDDWSTRESERDFESEPTVTLSEYMRIQPGMTYWEVRNIIGESGEEGARSVMEAIPGVIDRHEVIIYRWVNEGGGNMSATFENDRLTVKAQFGLR